MSELMCSQSKCRRKDEHIAELKAELAALRDKERENFNAEVETNKRHDILAGQGRRLYKQFKKNMNLEEENAKLRDEISKLEAALSVRRSARAVFRALPPPGALPDDWDSGAEIGANNAERVRYTMAASKILKALLQEKGE